MTSTQAQHTRRAVLQAAIDANAHCHDADLDLFFRGDREHHTTWQARRTEALRLCAGCPARAACEELALRDGDGRAGQDDMVRGGRTGLELADARDAQAVRLAAAVDADLDTEGRRLDRLTADLRVAATADTDRTVKGRRVPPAQVQDQQNTRVRELADEVRQIRTARRARAGWEVAA
ncbi:WhiB family transcriptional regulator (plasmid) [Streptomyces sp. NBC_01754]|uniref:WhiB family transcriptional regulator n=1 Tax=Streptomyces sp. NBC_01754 TaxID=2975930 RepID=UPI002DDAA6F1|nr:WhiB family transcriptional regulator [Streptomyces sp. NBC_01754]WSC97075.1 WhiB family transcriptional regulator [Streptomyces sp. NBC_01754]